MGQIDLRGYNIKTEDEAIEFLNLFISKAPQVADVLKSNRMKVASLKARLNLAQSQVGQSAPQEIINKDASVLDRMTGKVETGPSAAERRIQQMKAAQEEVAEEPKAQALPVEVEPGEIGTIHIEEEVTKVPKQKDVDNVPEVEVPSKEDTTPIGTKIAKKTGGKIDNGIIKKK